MNKQMLSMWLVRSLVASLALTVGTSHAAAGPFWDWLTGANRTAQPIPVGPPIFTPNPNPPVVGFGPTVPAAGATSVPLSSVPVGGAPTTGVPAASVPPTLAAPPSGFVAPAAPSTGTSWGANYCPTCPQQAAPQPVVSGYTPPNYQTNWVQVPVTTYRHVITTDPATGQLINAVQPCTTYTWQARRTPSNWFSNLWPQATPPQVAAPVATAPVVTGYAPQAYAASPATAWGTTTNFAPQSTVVLPQTSNYAPATITVPEATCAGPAMTSPTTSPHTGFPAVTSPPSTSPLSSTPPSTYPLVPSAPGTSSTTIMPRSSSGGTVPADVAPRLDPSGLNGGSTIRNYPPTEVERQPVVPVPVPDLQGSRTDGTSTNRAAVQTPVKQPSFVPFERPTPPANSTPPANKLRLVPDPDAERLELRREEIPNLINPGDRSTQRASTTTFASVPIQWPEHVVKPATQPTASPPASLELAPPQRKFTPAAITKETLDDRGWKSLSK